MSSRANASPTTSKTTRSTSSSRIENAGIVCVEVKGGEVWHDGEGWRQIRGGREHKIEPVRQAREACYALRDFVEKDPRWTQGRLRWDHVIVLPNTELSADFDLPECPRWKVIDRNDLTAPGRQAPRGPGASGARPPAAHP